MNSSINPEVQNQPANAKNNWITPGIELISKNEVEAKNAPAVNETSSPPGTIS